MASPWPLTFSSGEWPRALWALLFKQKRRHIMERENKPKKSWLYLHTPNFFRWLPKTHVFNFYGLLHAINLNQFFSDLLPCWYLQTPVRTPSPSKPQPETTPSLNPPQTPNPAKQSENNTPPNVSPLLKHALSSINPLPHSYLHDSLLWEHPCCLFTWWF